MAASRDEPPEAAGRAALRHARRLAVLVIGSTVCVLGLAMLFLPGPGLLGLFLGVSVLASEFAWARVVLQRAKRAVGMGGPDGEAEEAEKDER